MEDISSSPTMAEDLDDDTLLLREALAFIGDLDDGSLSPPFEDVDTLDGPSSIQTVESTGTDAFLASLLADPEVATTETVGGGADVAAKEMPVLSWPSTVSDASKPAKPAGNRARNKRRMELLYLRETVGELEQQLSGLKRQAEAHQIEKLEQVDESDRPSALVLAAWEQIATNQQAQRQESEMVNAKLKRLLEEQIQVGKSLERLLLRKRPKLETADLPVRSEKRPRHGSLSVSWDNQQIFHELLAGIGAQYADTARVLEKLDSLVHNKRNHRAVELVRDEQLGMVLRTTESRVLPFAYDLAVEEFWASIPPSISDKITGSHHFDVSDDVFKAHFQATANFGRATGEITAYMVDRRFREATRTVYVASGFFDPGHVSGTNMDGVYMRHKGWVVFEPLSASSGTTKAATRMTSYILGIPEVFDGIEDSTHKVGTLTDFVMTALSIELESRQQVFENRLFDRTTAAALRDVSI